MNVLKLSGYSQTKWMSEQITFAMGAKGFPVSVFRMPFIIGHTKSGGCNLTDSPARIMAAIIQLGEAPVSVQLDCVAVDIVARVVVKVGMHPQSYGVNAATGKLVEGDPRYL